MYQARNVECLCSWSQYNFFTDGRYHNQHEDHQLADVRFIKLNAFYISCLILLCRSVEAGFQRASDKNINCNLKNTYLDTDN